MKIQLGIDIGGTTVSVGGVLGTELVFVHSAWVAKGAKPLVEQVIKLWKWAMTQVGEHEVELSLGIGCPGTWQDGKILPGTALNLETYAGEMAGFNLAELVWRHLPKNWVVHVQNDAWTQAKGGVMLLSHSKMPCKWGYIGPGTGLGGAIVEVTAMGMVASDVGDLCAKAEPELCGRAIERLTGNSAYSISRSSVLADQFMPIFDRMGIRLGRLILDMVDQYQVDGILIGGSLGTQPPVSGWLLSAAYELISKNERKVPPIEVIHDPRRAAILGAANLEKEAARGTIG